MKCIRNNFRAAKNNPILEKAHVKNDGVITVVSTKNLTKVFKHSHQTGNAVTAVRKVSVDVNSGECFGWLGMNGAGKSTVFKILTGDISMTSGAFNILRTTSMGYCPQENALDSFLTVFEMLSTFAMFKGIPTGEAAQVKGQFYFLHFVIKVFLIENSQSHK